MVDIVKADDLLFDSVIQLLPDNVWNSPDYSVGCYEYYKQRPVDEGCKVTDCSFLIMESGPSILFRGAAVECGDKTNLIFAEVPCAAFEFKCNFDKKIKGAFKREVESLLEKIDGSVWCRDFLINGELSTLSLVLLSKGASAEPVFSQVIDITASEAMLKSKIRKSYKSLINWGQRELKPYVLNGDHVTWEHMDEFRRLHVREAGRQTRSNESWHKQFELVKMNKAFLVFGEIDNQLVSAGLFTYSKTNCYYQVSASRRDLFHKPLFHSLMWTAIMHAKECGCVWFEVGGQLFSDRSDNKLISKKELGISDFKAGFGGRTRVFLDISMDKGGNKI